MDVVVGRIGRPQGLRGEVTVEVRTDEPDLRFALGAALLTRRPGPAPVDPPVLAEGAVPAVLTVVSAREQNGRLMLGFAGIQDRTTAETLRDVLVAVEVDPHARPADPEEYYDHQLVGTSVRTVAGVDLGSVADVLHLPSQDVLVVRSAVDPGVPDLLVPFVAAIVPSVDLAARMVTIDPPPGLLGDTTDEPVHSDQPVEPWDLT